MTTRHRFDAGTAVTLTDALCAEQFGGAARCNLPYRSDWHYHDHEHPFSPREGGEECAWKLQEGVDRQLGLVCAADVDAQQHQLGRDEPVTVVMEYPQEELPSWRQAYITVPDEAATEVRQLAKEADSYRWRREGDLPPDPVGVHEPANVNEEAPQPEWSVAAGWLLSDTVSLNYGPWPIRKFLLCDEVTGNPADERWAYEEYLESLDKLGQDYVVTVYRPEGKAWRFAFVTWAWATGYDVQTACDELARVYG